MKNLAIAIIVCLTFLSCRKEPSNYSVTGPMFGTSFSIIYSADKDYTRAFDSLFTVVNNSMSTYIPDSKISKLNRNEDTYVDEHFMEVFEMSRVICANTNGAFDPTIGAVVNAWDFGPEGKIVNLDSTQINSIMKSVGLGNVLFAKTSEGYKIIKPEDTYIDFNAIAKGYAVDVIADFLSNKEIENYLVEIGGEIRVKGYNVVKNKPWKVGLDEPRFDGGQSTRKSITLEDCGMATSGVYRKFKIDENGNRYAHIIDTKTGYPSKTNVLSVSVIASDCMTADAYATAFQAMGIESTTEFLKEHQELKVFFIFEDDNNEIDTLSLNNFPEK